MARPCSRVFFLFVCVSAFLVSTAHSLPHYFSQRYGDTTAQWATGVATDLAGNMIVVGSFLGTINFGGANLTSAGSLDIFVAKFNSAGVHQWSMSFGDATQQEARAVKTDANGNIYVAGHFFGTFVVNGVPFTSAGGTDVYYLKLSPTGLLLAGQRFGDANFQYCNAIAVDTPGNFVLTGAFTGSLNFGGGNLTSAGDYDAFLVKFNTSAAHVWSKRFGDVVWQDASSVSIDLDGNVVMGGHYSGTFSFGGANVTGTVNVYVAKFNAAGVHQWSKGFGDSAGQYCNGVATDMLGNVVITGFVDGVINFGGSNLTGLGDLFLAKFDAAGVHQWSKKFGDAAQAQDTRAIACDGFNNIVIAGHFLGTIDLGGGVLSSAGGIDLLIAKFDPAGAHLWSRRYGDAAEQQDPRLALGTGHEVILAGYYVSSVNFGGSTLFSAGSYDVYLARLSAYPDSPVITSIEDIGNDQGRRVKIRFARSHHDLGTSTSVIRYEAYRRDDPPPASPALSSVEVSMAAIDGWTEVGSVAAHFDNSYGIDVPTIADSTIAAGMYASTFLIRAATSVPGTYWESVPASGYSLDNLAPGVPSGFVFNSGQLTWQKSTAEDFDYFSVYGSNTNSFASATLIDYSVSPALDVSASPYAYYFATATDFSGNEGKPAVINTLSGVDGTPRSYVLSISSSPNPFNPETTIRYTVPSKGRVTIGIYDVRGTRVRTLLDEERTSGGFTVLWDGRGDDGAIAGSGIYFARVEHPSGTKSYKMALLK